MVLYGGDGKRGERRACVGGGIAEAREWALQ